MYKYIYIYNIYEIYIYICKHNAHIIYIYISEIKLELSGIEAHFSRFTAYQPSSLIIFFWLSPVLKKKNDRAPIPFKHVDSSNELIWLVDWSMNFIVPDIRNIWEFHNPN